MNHLTDLLSPEELFLLGMSADLSESESQQDRDAVQPFCAVARLMLGSEHEYYFPAFMTALTAIERALRRKGAVRQ